MTTRTRLILGFAGVLVVFFGFLMLTIWDTYQIIPGGPKFPELPDLIVDGLAMDWASSGSCIGVHTAEFNVTVTIRNGGTKTAALPFGKSWVVIWSAIDGTAPPFKGWITGPPAQLASGQTATLTEKVAAIASVLSDKSAIGFWVMLDPDLVIPESSEDNNIKHTEIVFGGEICPPPK